jgi:hypothetical protein
MKASICWEWTETIRRDPTVRINCPNVDGKDLISRGSLIMAVSTGVYNPRFVRSDLILLSVSRIFSAREFCSMCWVSRRPFFSRRVAFLIRSGNILGCIMSIVKFIVELYLRYQVRVFMLCFSSLFCCRLLYFDGVIQRKTMHLFRSHSVLVSLCYDFALIRSVFIFIFPCCRLVMIVYNYLYTCYLSNILELLLRV